MRTVEQYKEIRYPSLKRLGTAETDGILNGDVYIFPKLDWTNAVIWYEDGKVRAGSRNRELTAEKDNAGFYKWVSENEDLAKFFEGNPNLILYWEWLVPHSIKDYEDDAWRNFYCFDVADRSDSNKLRFLTNEDCSLFESYYWIKMIPLIDVRLSGDNRELPLEKYKEWASYLLKEGWTPEGIVIKNYDFVNKFWDYRSAKIVFDEFNEKRKEVFGDRYIHIPPERKIVEKYVTKALVEKEYAKLTLDKDFTSSMIPEFLGRVYHCLIVEEAVNFTGKNIINFGVLNKECYAKTKELMPNVF